MAAVWLSGRTAAVIVQDSCGADQERGERSRRGERAEALAHLLLRGWLSVTYTFCGPETSEAQPTRRTPAGG